MPTRARADHPVADVTEDKYTVTEWNGITLEVKKKFPMFGFMKRLEESPISAIALILSPETLAVIEEVDMGFEDLDSLLNAISEAMGLKNRGN